MNQKLNSHKGFIQVPLLVGIIVSIAIISLGSYGGFEYYKTSKIIKEAKQLSKDEKYEEAIQKLEFAQHKLIGKLLNRKILTEIEEYKKLLENKKEYYQGLEEFNKGNWEKAKELLSKVSEISPYYQDAKNKIEEAEKQWEKAGRGGEYQKPGEKQVVILPPKEKEAEIKVPTEEKIVEESATNLDRPATKPANFYATIIKLSDSKGNEEFQSEYNGKKSTWPSPWPELKEGETITIRVDVDNPTSNPVFYQFNGPGFPNTWQTENWVTVTIDKNIFNLETIHLKVFVKNSDNQYRAPYYDDMIQVFYRILLGEPEFETAKSQVEQNEIFPLITGYKDSKGNCRCSSGYNKISCNGCLYFAKNKLKVGETIRMEVSAIPSKNSSIIEYKFEANVGGKTITIKDWSNENFAEYTIPDIAYSNIVFTVVIRNDYPRRRTGSGYDDYIQIYYEVEP